MSTIAHCDRLGGISTFRLLCMPQPAALYPSACLTSLASHPTFTVMKSSSEKSVLLSRGTTKPIGHNIESPQGYFLRIYQSAGTRMLIVNVQRAHTDATFAPTGCLRLVDASDPQSNGGLSLWTAPRTACVIPTSSLTGVHNDSQTAEGAAERMSEGRQWRARFDAPVVPRGE